MRIVVNDIAASTGGAMTVLRDFYTCVCRNDHENEWIFLLNDRYFPETENVRILTLPQVKNSRWKKLLFDFVTGRRYVAALAPDAVFSLQNIITFGLKVPQAVYIHQPIPFQSVKRFSFLKPGERKLAMIQYLIGGVIKCSAKRADRVIVQTAWVKNAVCWMCRLPREKVLASLPRVSRDVQLETGAVFDPAEFFYPTSGVIYKNNDCLRRASALLEERGIPHRVTLTLPPETGRGSVACVDRLPYEEVVSHYKRSTLVFPSYIETFGYPLAEARQVGSIVLAADTPFAREVLEGYENAYFFDPFRPDELADLMERVATGQILRQPSCPVPPAEDDGWERVVRWILEMNE